MTDIVEDFPCVAAHQSGYSPRDVQRYFAGQGPAEFLPVKGGFDPRAVDHAVDAREDRELRRRLRERLETRGAEAVLAEWQEESRQIEGRLSRPEGSRFRRPPRRRAQGYDAAEVDSLCRRMAEVFTGDPADAAAAADSETHSTGHRTAGQHRLTPSTLREALFTATQPGERSFGYEEGQVDAFLEDAVRLMILAEELVLAQSASSLHSEETVRLPQIPVPARAAAPEAEAPAPASRRIERPTPRRARTD